MARDRDTMDLGEFDNNFNNHWNSREDERNNDQGQPESK